MRLQNSCAISLALTLYCGHAGAQSLRDLFVSGLTADPQVAASEADLAAGEQRVREARAQFLPQLGLTASSSTGRFQPDNDGAESEFHTDRWSLQLTQALYGAQPAARLRAARAQLEIAELQLALTSSDLAARLLVAYFDLLGAREDVLALEHEHAAAELQLAAARRRFDQGTVANTEVLDAEARLDVSGAQQSAAEYDFALKQEAFRQLIGGSEFNLLLLPRDAPVPELPTDLLDRLILEALERNPAAQQARMQAGVVKLAIREARSGYLPSVDLSVSYGSDRSTGTPSNPAPVRGETLQAQATLRIPLFAGFANSARVSAAKADYDKSLTELESAERNVATEVRESYFGLRAALDQIRAQQTAERSTETAVRAQRKGYSVGRSTTGDVLEAESLYARTRRDLMKAKLEAHVNRIRLQIALGRPWRETIDGLSRLMRPAGTETPDAIQARSGGSTGPAPSTILTAAR